jgi:hypothetical protein
LIRISGLEGEWINSFGHNLIGNSRQRHEPILLSIVPARRLHRYPVRHGRYVSLLGVAICRDLHLVGARDRTTPFRGIWRTHGAVVPERAADFLPLAVHNTGRSAGRASPHVERKHGHAAAEDDWCQAEGHHPLRDPVAARAAAPIPDCDKGSFCLRPGDLWLPLDIPRSSVELLDTNLQSPLFLPERILSSGCGPNRVFRHHRQVPHRRVSAVLHMGIHEQGVLGLHHGAAVEKGSPSHGRFQRPEWKSALRPSRKEAVFKSMYISRSRMLANLCRAWHSGSWQ